MHNDYLQLLESGFSLDFLKSNVGLFEDQLNTEEDFDIIRNDFSGDFLNGFSPCDNCVIVYICGCFNFLHLGHIEALTLTGKYFKENFGVEAKYVITPAHDSYIVEKKGGTGKPNIHERLRKIDELLQILHDKKSIDKNQFFVDIVPALRVKGEVNFPFLVDRLEHLKKIYGARYAAFVVGSDNAGFSYAWQNRKNTYFVEVNRNGKFTESNYQKVDKYVQIQNSRFSHFSSSKIRSGLLSPG